MTWYDPGKEADAPKHCLAQGCDVIAQHTDYHLITGCRTTRTYWFWTSK